jgi:hypothetical protein
VGALRGTWDPLAIVVTSRKVLGNGRYVVFGTDMAGRRAHVTMASQAATVEDELVQLRLAFDRLPRVQRYHPPAT